MREIDSMFHKIAVHCIYFCRLPKNAPQRYRANSHSSTRLPAHNFHPVEATTSRVTNIESQGDNTQAFQLTRTQHFNYP